MRIATQTPPPLWALVLVAFALSLGGCAQPDSLNDSIQATGIRLTLPRALSAEGLKAEVAFYQTSPTPQLIGGFDEPDLEEREGELWVAGERSIAPGNYLLRIYLSHVEAEALLWAGEWSLKAEAGKEVSTLAQQKSISSGTFLQFPGDAHPLMIGSSAPFGPDGETNIEQICTSDFCDGDTRIVCNDNGFGSTGTDCSAISSANGVWSCAAAECVLNCNGDYIKSDDTCSSECGDGIVTSAAGEVCDDGNTETESACVYGTPTCSPCKADCSEALNLTGPYCGDGNEDFSDGEVCDDSGESSTCDSDCTPATCGDGVVNAAADEQCDDSGESASCNDNCTDSSCGDGFINASAGESCDDSNTETETSCPYGMASCTSCSASCSGETPIIGEYCGDGIVNGPEGCDDGNTTDDGNRCSAECTCALGFIGAGCAFSDATTCNGNGVVSSDGSCTCDNGFRTAADCSLEVVVPDGMAEVPAGAFMMGCDEAVDFECEGDEIPSDQITLDAFFIDVHEVTAGEYKACVDVGACSYNGGTGDYYTYDNDKDDHPINLVNWNEATTYCAWKNKRLPTEAEWEKAARGTDGRIYPWGNQTSSCTYAVMNEGLQEGCGMNSTAPVGSKPAGASPYGVMDMSGNVFEWVNDWYAEDYYINAPLANPPGAESGASRVVRGGSFYHTPGYLRSSDRNDGPPGSRDHATGFRCAQSDVPLGMVEVPAGAFMMGCDDCQDDEDPYRQITLDRFLIDIHEVTAGEYKACVDAGACSYNGGTGDYHTYDNDKDDHPINLVNWNEATTYCAWKNKRLPSEAEWEKAARGTDGRIYPWGNQSVSCTYAVMNEGGYGCGTDSTAPVGSKPLGASPYGVLDMSGNVWEWVNDWYAADYYDTSPVVNPPGPESGTDRVLRGGSFGYVTSFLRSSYRFPYTPESRSGDVGFRCSQ